MGKTEECEPLHLVFHFTVLLIKKNNHAIFRKCGGVHWRGKEFKVCNSLEIYRLLGLQFFGNILLRCGTEFHVSKRNVLIPFNVMKHEKSQISPPIFKHS